MAEDWLWWRDGVIYQIYPRSFADSNGDGIGDLPGIIRKLDYLQELGVDAIWLSPIYPSPDVDFGYDVSDYTAINPLMGSMADFERLVAEAHQRKLRIILDMVLNHTSDQHPWFRAAASSQEDARHDWYLWGDPKPGRKPPNNWVSMMGGSGWEYVPAVDQFYFHMYYKQQPDLNWRNPQVQQALLEAMRFWLEKGVDGFRLDVFNLFFKRQDLADNPTRFGVRDFDRQLHLHDCDQPEMVPALAAIRRLLDAYPERYAVGELFEPEAYDLLKRGKSRNVERTLTYVSPQLLHGVFNFDLLHATWSAGKMQQVIREGNEGLPNHTWPTVVLGNHDQVRMGTRYARGENDDRLKVAATLLLTLKGTPYLYYGDEIGMRDIPLRRDEIKDPAGRKYYPFYKGRDACRSPMQWTDEVNAGFTTGAPWLPVHPNHPSRNVAAQQADPDSLLNVYKRLLAIRREVVALRKGMLLPITYEPWILLAYLRQYEDQTVLVALNFSRRRTKLVLGRELMQRGWDLLFSSKRAGITLQGNLLHLAPEEALVLLQK